MDRRIRFLRHDSFRPPAQIPLQWRRHTPAVPTGGLKHLEGADEGAPSPIVRRVPEQRTRAFERLKSQLETNKEISVAGPRRRNSLGIIGENSLVGAEVLPAKAIFRQN